MGLSVLYVCNEDRATTKQRLLALKDMNVALDVIYTALLDEKVSLVKRVCRAIQFRLGFFPERNNENAQIIEKLRHKKCDILFVEKGLSIKPSTLIKVKKNQPEIKIVSYTLDDVMNPGNSSWYYRKDIPLYDFHFTNKKYNVKELSDLGAKKVRYFRNAYSKHVHHPVTVSREEADYYGADVSFIGTYEKERVELLRHLADNGIQIKVWGWGKNPETSGMIHDNILMTGKYVYDDEYAKVVCASKINLCFLRKINRDKETTRSIEIPACGGFMIAERTAEHAALFEEDKEAVYFEGKEELLSKVTYYLKETDKRTTIASNGLNKCLQEDYSYHHQLQSLFSIVLEHEKISDRKHASYTV